MEELDGVWRGEIIDGEELREEEYSCHIHETCPLGSCIAIRHDNMEFKP